MLVYRFFRVQFGISSAFNWTIRFWYFWLSFRRSFCKTSLGTRTLLRVQPDSGAYRRNWLPVDLSSLQVLMEHLGCNLNWLPKVGLVRLRIFLILSLSTSTFRMSILIAFAMVLYSSSVFDINYNMNELRVKTVGEETHTHNKTEGQTAPIPGSKKS